MTSVLTTCYLTAVGIDRDPAARHAREELLKQEYQSQRPGLMQRLLQWLGHKILEVMASTSGGNLGLVIFLTLMLVGVVVVVVMLRRRTRLAVPSTGKALFDGPDQSSAQQHREQAQRYARQHQWDLAVRERLRAIARHVEQAGVLQPRPGRTAEEIAAEAGRLFPPISGDLRVAVRCFEDVWYGQHQAGSADYALLCEKDQRISAQRWRAEPPAQASTPVGVA